MREIKASAVSELVPGALYAVRWNVVPNQPPGIARWFSDRDDPGRDSDEEPREWWEFFGNDLTGEPGQYAVLCRLLVQPALVEPISGLTELLAEHNRNPRDCDNWTCQHGA